MHRLSSWPRLIYDGLPLQAAWQSQHRFARGSKIAGPQKYRVGQRAAIYFTDESRFREIKVGRCRPLTQHSRPLRETQGNIPIRWRFAIQYCNADDASDLGCRFSSLFIRLRPISISLLATCASTSQNSRFIRTPCSRRVSLLWLLSIAQGAFDRCNWACQF